MHTVGATLRCREQAGKSAQGFSTSPGWGTGGKPQFGDGKRCSKEKRSRQNFRVVLEFKNQQNPLEGLLKGSCLSPTPKSWCGMGWGPSICISSRFPGDADTVGPGSIA